MDYTSRVRGTHNDPDLRIDRDGQPWNIDTYGATGPYGLTGYGAYGRTGLRAHTGLRDHTGTFTGPYGLRAHTGYGAYGLVEIPFTG